MPGFILYGNYILRFYQLDKDLFDIRDFTVVGGETLQIKIKNKNKPAIIEYIWQNVQKKNTLKAYEHFLAEYQNEPLASDKIGQARIKINEMQASIKPGFITVFVSSDIGWVSVYHDNKKLFDTPAPPYEMKPGTYTIKLYKQGKKQIMSQVVTVKSGETAVIDLRK